MRAVVKSYKDLKGTKVFAFGRSVRNLKNFSKFTGTLAKIFYCCNVAVSDSLQKNQSKGYLGNFIKKGHLHRKNTFL